MPLSPSFGSLGDIISLCILVKDICKSFDHSRGSSVEYQAIIADLCVLEDVLLQAALIWEQNEGSDDLEALRVTACRTAEQCRGSMERFRKNVKQFQPSLRSGGSGNIFRDAMGKFHWQISQTNELTKFRAEIIAHCTAMNVVLNTANLKTMKLNNEKLNARLESSADRRETLATKEHLLLTQLADKLNDNNEEIRSMNTLSSSIAERFDWIRNLGQDIKSFMQGIFMMTCATYRIVNDIQSHLQSHLERALCQEPLILEDALGRIFPIGLQFVNSWDAFDAVLEMQFRRHQGHRMVQQKQYVLHETVANRDILRHLPWQAELLPGQRVVMCMLFPDSNDAKGCPKCHLLAEVPEDSEITCAGCATCYRRKQMSSTELIPVLSLRHRSNFKKGVTHPVADSIAFFKRVRMFPEILDSIIEDHLRAYLRGETMILDSTIKDRRGKKAIISAERSCG